MLQEILAWFVQQLGELLPPSLRGAGRRLPDAVVVRTGPVPRDAELMLRRGGRTTRLGPIDLETATRPAIRRALGSRPPSRVAVQLPPAALLERAVTLPLAAERDYRQVLGYEVDRYTPFAAADVFWSALPERRDRARGRLHLRLGVVPKAAVQPTLDALAAAGLAPAWIEVPVPDGPGSSQMRVIDLGRGPSRSERWNRRALNGAAVVCAGLAVVAIALPFLLQWRAGNDVEARIAVLQPRVQEAQTLRQRIAGAANGANTIAAEQARVGDALQVLATVTQLLPDDTYLTNLSLRQRKLGLEGQSAAAAKLIALLSDDPIVRNPSFNAPITRTDRNSEIFSIRAEIAP